MSEESKWRPWGYDDYDSVPGLSEEALSAAMDILNPKDDAQRIDLKARFHGVAITYWRTKREVETPGPRWYRQQIQPIQTAAARLLSVVRALGEGTGRSALVHLTKVRMHRALRGSTDPESIEQLLETFKSVCDECLRLKRGSWCARASAHRACCARACGNLARSNW
jgi:hypothetical protein